MSAVDPDNLILIRSEADLRDMETYLLATDREEPVVALAPALAPGTPTLAADDARAIIGPAPRLYSFVDDDLLDKQRLPDELALTRGCTARLWQPGLTTESDPADHPAVRPLGSESRLEVLALRFDLSRPRVRKEIKRIENNLVFTKRQLDIAITQLSSKHPPRSLTKTGI